MIIVHDLYKKFGSLEVMKGLNLEVKTGETLVILGRSGVGKSVLLKHILGLSRPDAGYIEVDGINITSLRGDNLYRPFKIWACYFKELLYSTL